MVWTRSISGDGFGSLDHRVGGLAQSRIVETSAEQLQLHLETAGIADALDRRRHDDECAAFGHRLELFLQSRKHRHQRLVLRFFAFAPIVEDHVVDAGVGKRRAVVEDRDAGDGDDGLHARRRQRGFRRLLQRIDRSSERRAVRHLHGDHRVALVLVGDKGGRQAADAEDSQSRDDEPDDHHEAAAPHQRLRSGSYSHFRSARRPQLKPR